MLKHVLFLVAALLAGFAAQVRAVTIDTVPVGNAGNATYFGAGAVGYDYRIGTTEVTNSQYVEFLNAKAASDPLDLYNTNMGSDARGGIDRIGASDGFTYVVKANMGNKPVCFVNWFDSLRFANWLNNGHGNGSTEVGAYTLLGGTPIPSNGVTIPRSASATWFLASDNEWVKAAYYDPTLNGGSGGYWRFPTKSNSEPTVATANINGDISNPGNNVANYNGGADWNGLNANLTTVGSAGPLSQSFYGTSDQGGNLWEWTETVVQDPEPNRIRIRGGYWGNASVLMEISTSALPVSTVESNHIGFRVALVPEPSSFVLAALGLIGLVVWRRKR